MGSGTFPVYGTDPTGRALLQLAEQIRAIADGFYSEVYSGESGGMQYDNAASDGKYLGYLNLAAELIERAVRKDK